MGWFSGIGHALNPANALRSATNPNPFQGVKQGVQQGFQGIRQGVDNVGADVRKSWDTLQPALKGAGDQIGRDFGQLRQGQLPSGPSMQQAADQFGRDTGAGFQGIRQGVDAAARDTRQGGANMQQAAQQQAQRMAGGMPGAMGGGGFGPQGMQGMQPPGGSKMPAPTFGARPPGMPPGAPQGGPPQGMPPQGGGMPLSSFGQAGQGGGAPPGGAKGGAPGGAKGGGAALNPQQQAMAQAAMLRGGGTAPGAPTQMMR